VVASLVFVNGAPCAELDVRDRGLAYGHGAFETMRLQGGQLPLWGYHLARLNHGLGRLGIDLDGERLRLALDTALANFPPQGVVKLTVTAGVGERGYRMSGHPLPTLLIQWFPPPGPREVVKLQVCRYALPHNHRLAGIKHLNRLDQVLAAAELDPGCQGLLLDCRGNVIEALSHNIFLRHRGWWLTPDLSLCGVAGVLRAVLLEEIMPALGLTVEIARVSLEQLFAAEEVFICNSVTGIQAVAAVDDSATWSNHAQTQSVGARLEEAYPCFAA